MAIVADRSGNNPTDSHNPVGKPVFKCLKFEQVTVGATAVGLNPHAAATVAEIVVENFDVRYRDDGVDPTSSVGELVKAGTPFQYAGDLTRIKFISTTGSNATLDVSYYR